VRDVLISVGEASGDLHGAALVSALTAAAPGVRVFGLGGPRMAAVGVGLMDDPGRLSVMGFVEVLRTIPHHWGLLRRIEQRLARGTVGLVIVMDYPGFNMRVAAAARRHGVPVLYYITPQVWAWGAGRLPKLARLVTHAAVILPFEQALLAQHGIAATFVGHPLLDRMGDLPSRDAARESLGVPSHRRLLALFPGSRRQEVDRHLEPFVATARLLQARHPDLDVVVSVAPGMSVDAVRCPYPLVHDATWRVLRGADAALCKSGTTTLEAAVAGCPLVVAYKTSAWTYAIARRVVRIPRIGLVNVVAGREVAPEFVQEEAEPGALAAALGPLLDHGSAPRATMLGALAEVRSRLGTAGAAERTAAIALGLLGG
jgi:lipid-A-disaccharide synthase